MTAHATAFFARIDSGEINAANAADAIERAGGLAFLIASMLASP